MRREIIPCFAHLPEKYLIHNVLPFSIVRSLSGFSRLVCLGDQLCRVPSKWEKLFVLQCFFATAKRRTALGAILPLPRFLFSTFSFDFCPSHNCYFPFSTPPLLPPRNKEEKGSQGRGRRRNCVGGGRNGCWPCYAFRKTGEERKKAAALEGRLRRL